MTVKVATPLESVVADWGEIDAVTWGAGCETKRRTLFPATTPPAESLRVTFTVTVAGVPLWTPASSAPGVAATVDRDGSTDAVLAAAPLGRAARRASARIAQPEVRRIT